MAKTNNTKKILVWSTVVAILGVGSYFGYKVYKKYKEKKGSGGDSGSSTSDPSAIDSGNSSGSSSGSESPFKTVAEIKAFQDWLDITHPLWINDNGKWKNLRVGTATEPNRHVSGKGYGTYGKSTASAYSKWGSEYAVKPKVETPSAVTPSKVNQLDIDKIKGNAYLTPAQKNALGSKNADYIKSWANGFRNSRSTFIWANQVYRTATGEKILTYNPVGKAHIVKNGGNIAFPYPTKKSGSGEFVASTTDVGIVRDIKFNEGELWFYLPDNGGFNKWGVAQNFIQKMKF